MCSPDRIRRFVLERIGRKARLPGAAVLETFDYIDSGHVDSFGMLRFVMEMESEFGITFSDADLLNPRFRSVGGVIALVGEKVAARAGA
jgi:acyl carrier protein